MQRWRFHVPYATGDDDPGLLRYQKHWCLNEVDVKVRGELLSGIPIGVKGDALCLINREHRYFIPLDGIDYIRTPEGLDTCFDDLQQPVR